MSDCDSRLFDSLSGWPDRFGRSLRCGGGARATHLQESPLRATAAHPFHDSYGFRMHTAGMGSGSRPFPLASAHWGSGQTRGTGGAGAPPRTTGLPACCRRASRGNRPAVPIPQKLGKLGKLPGPRMTGELIAVRLHAFPLALCTHAGPGAGCPPGVVAGRGMRVLRHEPTDYPDSVSMSTDLVLFGFHGHVQCHRAHAEPQILHVRESRLEHQLAQSIRVRKHRR